MEEKTDVEKSRRRDEQPRKERKKVKKKKKKKNARIKESGCWKNMKKIIGARKKEKELRGEGKGEGVVTGE